MGMGGRGRWVLYLLFFTLAVVGIWNSVRVSNATELASHRVFVSLWGGCDGYVRWMSASELLLERVGGLCGGIAGVAGTQTLAPLVEIEDRKWLRALREKCS